MQNSVFWKNLLLKWLLQLNGRSKLRPCMMQVHASLLKLDPNEPCRCLHLKSSKVNLTCRSCPTIQNKAALPLSSPLSVPWPWLDGPPSGLLWIRKPCRKDSVQVRLKPIKQPRSKRVHPPPNSSLFVPVHAPCRIPVVRQRLHPLFRSFKRDHSIPIMQQQRPFRPMLVTVLQSSAATPHPSVTATYTFNTGLD